MVFHLFLFFFPSPLPFFHSFPPPSFFFSEKTLEIAHCHESHEEKEGSRFIISCWKLKEINKYIEVKKLCWMELILIRHRARNKWALGCIIFPVLVWLSSGKLGIATA